VWDFEDLFGALSELVNLAFNTHLFDRILDLLDINHTFISEGMEKVERLDGLLASLLVPEDEVDPLVQMIRDIL
jgi:hypothetical protein